MQRYSTIISSTSALDGGGRSTATTPPLYPREKRHSTACTGGRVGPSGGLDGFGKYRHHPNSIPGPSSSQRDFHSEDPQILSATVRNLVAPGVLGPGICTSPYCTAKTPHWNYSYSCFPEKPSLIYDACEF